MLAYELIVEHQDKKIKRLEEKIEAYEKLSFTWSCFTSELPSFYGKELWEKHKATYLKDLNEQEAIIYGEKITVKL